MIREFEQEDVIRFSKMRINEPYKLLFIWFFSVGNIVDDIEYFFQIENPTPFQFCSKMFFYAIISVFVGLFYTLEFMLQIFNLDDFIVETIIEFTCATVIISLFGVLKIPFSIYTFIKFDRVAAISHILKSN